MERAGATKGAARAALSEAIQKREKKAAAGELTGNSTVAQLLAFWWPHKIATTKTLSVGTRANYEDIMRRIIVPGLGSVRLHEATTGRIDKWLLGERGSRATQADIAQTILRQAFNLAAQHDAIPSNPVVGVSRRVKPEPVPRALTPEELVRMRAAAAGMRINTWLADVFEVQLGLALRIGEALALRVENLDLDNPAGARVRIEATVITPAGQKHSRQAHTKAGPDGSRVVQVPDWVVVILRHRALISTSGLIFETRNATLISPRNFRESWRNVRGEAGLEWVTPHHMRKTSLTLIARELGEEAAQLMAGHSSILTTRAHYIEKQDSIGPDARIAISKLAPPTVF